MTDRPRRIFAAFVLAATLTGAGIVAGHAALGNAPAPSASVSPTPSDPVPPLPSGPPNPSPFPPTVPADLHSTAVNATSVTLAWTASHGGCCGVDHYLVTYTRTSDGAVMSADVGNVTTATITTGITPGQEYSFQVSAWDDVDHHSAPSNQVVVVTPGPARCHAAYRTTSTWTGGFVAEITVTNTGPAALDGWALAFTFGGDQRVGAAWNAVATQSGATVTLTNVSWNRTLAPGATATIGAIGSWKTNNAAPTAFTLNGGACG